jgi:hypothetical protein
MNVGTMIMEINYGRGITRARLLQSIAEQNQLLLGKNSLIREENHENSIY